MSKYLSIITLNVKGLNPPITEWQVGLKTKQKKSRTYNMLLRRNAHQDERHTQTESERMEKRLHANGNKTVGGSDTHIRQNKL